jgi:apolipoprotein D and lipocalin family protein
MRTIKGKARVVDPKTNSKLKVTFPWPFAGDYWILELGKDYEYAVVGEASRKYLWVLSRSPQMKGDIYDGIIGRLREKGFDVPNWKRTLKSP